MHTDRQGASFAGAYVMGLAFAFGWTPCIGPVLATVLTLAANEASLGAGVRLLFVYSLGLGIPFILAAVAIGPFLGFLKRFRRHLGRVEMAMGVLLVLTGVLILTGGLNWFGTWMIENVPALARIEEMFTPKQLQTDILQGRREMSDREASAAPTAIALTIAGSDSSGGAGIQADLKTFSAFGVYGASVITALTAQNTHGVQGVETVSPAFVAEQLNSVLSDLDVGAIKTGMLANAAIVETVARRCGSASARPLVVDPVMVATSGDVLLAPDAVEALKKRLLAAWQR